MTELEQTAELFVMGLISKEELLLKLLETNHDWDWLRARGLIESVQKEMFVDAPSPNTRCTAVRTTITFLDRDRLSAFAL